MAITAPDVSPQPIPDVRLQAQGNDTTFGGGPGLAQDGQEVQKISSEAGEIAAFERIRANQTAVQDATAKLSAIHTDLLTNPQTGLPTYQGVNAMKGQSVLWQQYQKSANDIAGTLNGQEQQGAFGKIAVGMGDTFLQNVKAHVTQQLEKHDATSFEALVNNKATESGTSYGNAQALAMNNSIVDDAAQARAQRLGLDPDETKKFMQTVKTTYHEDVLSQMVDDPAFMGKAKEYFNTYKSEMDVESRDRVRGWFDTIPKQHEETSKAAEEAYYKANMRTAMLDMFDNKLTLSEVQRRFRNNQLNESDYNSLANKLSKPDAAIVNSFDRSDPQIFNEIRQAQLTGSKSPGEIQRMIMKGAASKNIVPDDGKYLMGLESNKPPTPRDKQVEANANYLRDIGNRYFASTNMFGVQTEDLKQKASQESEAMVQDFYTQADKAKVQGKDLDELRDRVRDTAARNRFPGLPPGEMPAVAIGINGQVTQLLNPDEKSKRKSDWTITRNQINNKEGQ